MLASTTSTPSSNTPVAPAIERVPGKAIRVFGTEHSYSAIHRGTGLSLSHVSRMFNGHRMPSGDALNQVAGYLGVSLDELYRYLSSIQQ